VVVRGKADGFKGRIHLGKILDKSPVMIEMNHGTVIHANQQVFAAGRKSHHLDFFAVQPAFFNQFQMVFRVNDPQESISR
jgi:hypothetical protein